MKILATILFLLISETVFACPMCSGSMDNPKDRITTYVLIGFILFLYIPYIVIYRAIKKGSSGSLEQNISIKNNEQTKG